jgi:hypothetical protein
VILESLGAIKRAGADLIFSYFALDLAEKKICVNPLISAIFKLQYNDICAFYCLRKTAGGVTMFSLDSVLDDLWPQARPAPGKSLLKRLFYEDEFQHLPPPTAT